MADYQISDTTMTAIADAVRNKRWDVRDKIIGSEIANKINGIRLGVPVTVSCHIGDDGKWHRPDEWPDLDALWATNYEENTVYLTYDARDPADRFIGLSLGGAATVDCGYVDDDGQYNIIETYTVNGDLYTAYNNDGHDYVVFKVTKNNTASTWYFRYIPTSVTGTVTQINSLMNKCVERVGEIPYCTGIGTNNNNNAFGTYSLEHDACPIGGNVSVTNLSNCWQYCYSLQSLDLSGWDTSNWAVTNLSNCWCYCYSLQSLDLSGWDTSNWAVTNIAWMIRNCYSLNTYPFSDLDTAKFTNRYVDLNSCLSLTGTVDLTNFGADIDGEAWGCQNIDRIIIPNGIHISFNISGANKLTRENLLQVIDCLATVTTTTKLTLGNLRYKLTADDIAIATNKGWTIA